MGDRSSYLREYWKEALCRAWRDAMRFAGSHVKFGVLVGVVAYLYEIRDPIRAGLRGIGGNHVLILAESRELLRALAPGRGVLLATVRDLGTAAVLTYLWHLIILTPARIRRDLVSRSEASENLSQAIVEQYSATQPNLEIDFAWKDNRAVFILKNSGAAAEYDASLMFSHEFVSLPRRNLFCEKGRQERLPKGTSRLLLAELNMHPRDPVWLFYCVDASKQIVSYSLAPRLLNGAYIDVEVVCHPENVAGIIRKRIVFNSMACSEQQLTPPADPPPATASD